MTLPLIEFISPPTLSLPAALSPKQYKLCSFHVGQGMCSLLYNEDLKYGIFFDAGAGTPIKRDEYQKQPMNAIKKAISNLETLDLILSHPDSDHWRLIAWDPVIRQKANRIFTPRGAKSIAFQDTTIAGKIKEVDSAVFPITSSICIYLLRSEPLSLDDNGDGLVVIVKFGSKNILFPGDYVYNRYAKDKNACIRNIHKLKFYAVVVPHHGDFESGDSIVPPSTRKSSKAIFLAGDHQGYRHPTPNAVDSHKVNFIATNDTNNNNPVISRIPII
jgi:beta-lactamase superfamily II metal-dependent hydrolase